MMSYCIHKVTEISPIFIFECLWLFLSSLVFRLFIVFVLPCSSFLSNTDTLLGKNSKVQFLSKPHTEGPTGATSCSAIQRSELRSKL